MSTVRELSTEECQGLIRGGVFGRIAITASSGPHLIPVNYSVVGETIVVATSAYSVLAREGRDTHAAFEIDGVDYERQSGWSVVVHGQLWMEEDEDELDRIHAEWPPHPWPDGTRSLFLRLSLDDVSGRRVGGGTATVVPPVHRTLGAD